GGAVGAVCRGEKGRVLSSLLRQRQELITQGVRRLQLSAHVIIIPQTTQHGEKLLRSFQVFTELSGTGVGLCPLRNRRAFRGNQRCPQGKVHIHFLLDAL